MKRRYFLLSLASLSVVTGCSALQSSRSQANTAETVTQAQAQQVPTSIEVTAQASSPASSSDPVFAENGVAIRGADPVAYFTVGEPVLGSEQFTHNWKGVTWRFASAENRDRFIANPERYAPQYGGFCAFAVARGYTASIIPEAWTIVNNKLYLNFSLGVRRQWERDIPGNIAKGNQNWPEAANDFRG